MNEKELLEKAAKATNRKRHPIISDAWSGDGFELMRDASMSIRVPTVWNPLENDGDALRLAVKLAIPFHVFYEGGSVVAYGKKTKHHPEGLDIQELFTSNPYEATRRAIVRAAAAMAKE